MATKVLIEHHLDKALDCANTAEINIIGGTGEARLCELGILHGLVALCFLVERGLDRLEPDLYGRPLDLDSNPQEKA